MDIDQSKLAQMRAESQDAQTLLEEALLSTEEKIDDYVFEQDAVSSIEEQHQQMSLSPIKEKIGKLHLAFLKEIHDFGKKSNESNDAIEAITKKYHINLFDALTSVDQVSIEKYGVAILKSSFFDVSAKQIRIEFNSDNVEKFLNMENGENWKSNYGCNSPDDTDFRQQISIYLSDNGFLNKNSNTKTEQVNKISRAINEKSRIEFVSYPELEKEFGISIQCSATREEKYVKVFAKIIAIKKISAQREIHFIAYDKDGQILDRTFKWWENFGLMQTTEQLLEPVKDIVKIEYFPVEP